MELTFSIYLWLLQAKQLRGGGLEVLMLNFDSISDIRYNGSLSETGGGALVRDTAVLQSHHFFHFVNHKPA